MSTPDTTASSASAKMLSAVVAVVVALPLIFFPWTVAIGVICAICAVILVIQGWFARHDESAAGFRTWMLLIPLIPAVAIIALRGFEAAQQLLSFFETVA